MMEAIEAAPLFNDDIHQAMAIELNSISAFENNHMRLTKGSLVLDGVKAVLVIGAECIEFVPDHQPNML